MSKCEVCHEEVKEGERFLSNPSGAVWHVNEQCDIIGISDHEEDGCCSCHLHPPCSYCVDFPTEA